MMTNPIENESGFTLLGVLMILAIFSILGFSILAMASSSIKLSDSERDDQSVFYIAEGGAIKVLSDIEKEVGRLSKTATSETDFFNKLKTFIDELDSVVNFIESQAIAEVEINQINSPEYRIISKGKIGNNTRKVEGAFIVKFEAGEPTISIPPGVGVYLSNKMEINNGTINGDLILNSNNNCNTISIDGNPTINGVIKIPQNGCEGGFQATDWWINNNKPIIRKHNTNFDFPLPKFPDFPEYPRLSNSMVDSHKNINISTNRTMSLDANYQINNINFNSDAKLTLDIGNKDVSIVVNRIAGGGHLDIKGTGKLTIYVKDNIELSGHINQNGQDDLIIYIGPSSNPNSTKTLKSSQYGDFIASIYAKDANIELVGSGKIRGDIVTGGNRVKLSGDSSGKTSTGYAVYAPNASVELSGSGSLVGSIISKVFKISGGGWVTQKDVNSDKNPFFPGDKNIENKVEFDLLHLIEK